MKQITLSQEARERLARQIADTSGVVADCRGAKAAPAAA